MVNLIIAVAYHICPNLAAAFTQPGALTLANLYIVFMKKQFWLNTMMMMMMLFCQFGHQ